jgi:hypothetical protein
MGNFDWTPYFAGWTASALLSDAMLGAMAFAPLVLGRLAYRLAIDVVARVSSLIVRR